MPRIKIVFAIIVTTLTIVAAMFLYCSSKAKPNFNLGVIDKSLIKPEFNSSEFGFIAGTGFLLNFESKTLLLTAHHLFGPAGGLERSYSWQELRELAPTVGGYSLNSGEIFNYKGVFLPIENAEGLRSGSLTTDLAVFEIFDYEDTTFNLSDDFPKVGETVYLYARLRNQSDGDNFIHPATVTQSKENILEYKYYNRIIDPRGTSGAPVLNANGKVVGLNLAAAGVPFFSWKGRANPAILIRETLNRALVKKVPGAAKGLLKRVASDKRFTDDQSLHDRR